MRYLVLLITLEIDLFGE